jgi:ankyrin repeat protein
VLIRQVIFRSILTDVGINYQTAAGRTPLMVATARGSLRVMELLLHHGARLNIKDTFGQTAESFSVIFNQKQSRRVIIQFKWKKRNEASMIQEREVKTAMSRESSKIDQAAEEVNRKRQERVTGLANQRKQRQEEIATLQLRLRKKKSKNLSFLFD